MLISPRQSWTVQLSGSEQIQIRRVSGIEEYQRCEALQARIWGVDDIVRVPTLDLITAQENGGIVLGAFHPEGEMVGFVYSFPGRTRSGRWKQCSIVMGVDAAYRSLGLGYHLKMAQRETAMAEGFDLVTWTFDPLQTVNAYLNLHKLGAQVRTYLVNHYGTGNGLNAGLETDRFLVEWDLSEPALHRCPLPLEQIPVVNQIDLSPVHGLPLAVEGDEAAEGEWLRVQVPNQLALLKTHDLPAARHWRAVTRSLFQSYLAKGYVLVDLKRGVPCSSYILQKEGGP